MSLNLTDNIVSPHIYNIGGISEIWLLDINDFISFKFKDDDLYDNCYIEAISKDGTFIELGRVNESNLTSSYSDGIYRTTLNTFIHSLNSSQESHLLKVRESKCLVIIRTLHSKYFAFGSDGGATLTYNPQSGQNGDVHGYVIQLEKRSIYPLFEIDPEAMKTKVLGSEATLYIITENNNKTDTNYLIEIP